MNRKEFSDWFTYHRAAFPSMDAWLGRFPRSEPTEKRIGDPPSQPEILRSWFKVLGNVELEDAKSATDALAAGDEERPDLFDNTAAAVRKASRSFLSRRRFTEKKQYDSPEATYRCWLCEDFGWVGVLYPASVAIIERTWPDGPPDWFECAEGGRDIRWGVVLCVCERGDVYAKHWSSPRYDSAHMCRYNGVNFQQVREWFAARRESQKFQVWEPAGGER